MQPGNPYAPPYPYPPPPMVGAPPMFGRPPGQFFIPPPPGHPMMPPMPVPPGTLTTTIIRAPTIAPPPGWKPSLTVATSNSQIRQPITLFIGKIPSSLEDAILQKVFECCGLIQKWNRPVDKAFGFVTFEYGISGVRCMSVLPQINFNGSLLDVRISTKEKASLDVLIEDEQKFSSEEEIRRQNQIVRDNINLILHPSQPAASILPQLSIDDIANGVIAAGTAQAALLSGQGDEAEMRKEAASEIEKFRQRQAERDKELERKKLEKVKEKIKDLQGLKRREAEEGSKGGKQKAAPASYAELLIDSSYRPESSSSSSGMSVGARRSRDDSEDVEDEDAKRRRKQQVLELLAANEIEQVAIKVKIPSVPVAPLPAKRILTTVATADDHEDQPKRLLVPLDYADDDDKRDGQVQYVHEQDDEDMDGNYRKLSPTSAAEAAKQQAKSINISMASAKAAEMAAKISSSVQAAASQLSEDERQKLRQKQIVDKIPTDKNDLFAYRIDWDRVERLDLINSAVKSWVIKKVVEYLGEEEETLISFILNKLTHRCIPGELLTELSAVLDEDAEQFVVKLWRMLIFLILKD